MKLKLVILLIIVYEIILFGLSVKFPDPILLLFFLRVPVITALFLFTLPLLAKTKQLSPMLKNLFILSKGVSLLLVVILTCAASITVIEVGLSGFSNAYCRFDDLDKFSDPVKNKEYKSKNCVLDESNNAETRILTEQTSMVKTLQPFNWYQDSISWLDDNLSSFSWYQNSISWLNTNFFKDKVMNSSDSLSFLVAILVQLLMVLILASSIIWHCIKFSVEIRPFHRFLWTLGGLGSSFVVYVMFKFDNVVNRFIDARISSIAKEVEGFFDIPIHGLENLLVVYSIIILLFYFVLGFVFNPTRKKFQAPALYFLLLNVTALCLFFGAVTFFFDVVRVPVFGTLILVTFVIYISGVDHFYETTKLNGEEIKDVKKMNKEAEAKEIGEAKESKGLKEKKKAKEKTETVENEYWKTILEKRLGKNNDTLIVVCAAGGGIQAAGWVARVLKGLSSTLKEKFTNSVGLISSVSGGSVGSMYYLDAFNEHGKVEDVDDEENECVDNSTTNNTTRSRKKEESIFARATQDSLSATVWGIAYTDMLRFLGLPFLVWGGRKRDRGWALEQRLEDVMHKHEHNNDESASFKNWRKSVLEGNLPIPVFNATVSENGLRFLLSPISFGKGLGQKVEEFNNLYEEYDIKATTAARLSATFSYVTPIARNDKGTPVLHIADGGYFDNFGVFTSVEWLDNQVLKDCKSFIKKVVLLEIRSFPNISEDMKKNPPPPWNGWQAAFLGPLQTLANVRTSTQKARNEKEIELLQERWKNRGVTIDHIVVGFPSELNGKKAEEPPLSWKLTRKQKCDIQKAWKVIEEEKDDAKVMATLRKHLKIPKPNDNKNQVPKESID